MAMQRTSESKSTRILHSRLGRRLVGLFLGCAIVPLAAFAYFALAGVTSELGEENVLFETDFPHPTCLYPNVREHVESSLEGLSEQAKRKVLFENAARVYQLPLPA